MTRDELLELVANVKKLKSETSTLEIKTAASGCPKRLYDTFSSFSNQDEGGIILFGISEEAGYRETGVYDAADLQRKINEQALQMEPVVRPLLTVAEKDGKVFVSAEIPGLDISERPCFYKGHGRMKGSFVRVGDSDEQMTEYEIYSYENFRKKHMDDIRPVKPIEEAYLDDALINVYVDKLTHNRPNFSHLEKDEILKLKSIVKDGQVTISGLFMFGNYPQMFFPQLCIIATAVPGTQMGELGETKERFIDSRRIEGNIRQMLEEAIQFVRHNMKTKTIIDPVTGMREDRSEYPITAVREVLLNALLHRDYSVHTEGMPIQLIMYADRIEVRNPGGLYGRTKASELGKVQPDTRNPVLANGLETLGLTENRYSGIPTIRRMMKEQGLPEPVFSDERGSFVVTLFKEQKKGTLPEHPKNERSGNIEKDLAEYCRSPRTRDEICEYLQLQSKSYVVNKYILPLVDAGILKLTLPDVPRSTKQKYVAAM